MQWHLFAIGKPRLPFARAGVEEYLNRLQPIAPVSVEYVKPAGGETESAALLRRSHGMFRAVLDERGAQCTSAALADRVTAWEHERLKRVALLIGGADGHTPELRRQADWLWSLGKLTLPHEMALVIALEQIYRAYTIKAGLPYHRA